MNILKNLLIFAFTVGVMADQSLITVVKVRGKVYQSSPENLKPSLIKKGDKLKENTTLSTSEKSFVVVKYLDNSTVSLGPKGKLILSKVATKKSNYSVINHIDGKVRSVITKKQKAKKSTFYVKTKSAAMGVRGTEFDTIYNPKNKTTMLITYEGRVDIATLKTDNFESLFIKDQNNIEKLLRSKNAVQVTQGQVTNAVFGQRRPMKPKRVSPTQLRLLKKQNDLSRNKRKKRRKKRKIFLEKMAGTVLVDPDTGFIIEGTKNSTIDKMGFVDSVTGRYIAPNGIKLDAVQGFLPKDPTKESIHKVDNLNISIQTTVNNIQEVTSVAVPKPRSERDQHLLDQRGPKKLDPRQLQLQQRLMEQKRLPPPPPPPPPYETTIETSPPPPTGL